MFLRSVPIVCALALSLAAPASGQGITSYLNFETPVHKPILVATIGAEPYLLVCNSQDNAVEVYSVANDPMFLLRVAVGQEPISIVAKPTPTAAGGRRFHVVNWLGDSITSFELTPSASGPPLLDSRVLCTVPVGDEPTMIAILPENPLDPATQPGGSLHESLLVTFSAPSLWGWFDGETLAPVSPGFDRREVLSSDSTRGVKDPRAIAFSPATAEAPNMANRLCILNFRGGNDGSNEFDLDLWSSDDVMGAALNQRADRPDEIGIGSTNFNMAFAANGDLWIASLHARNQDPLLAPDPVTAVGEPIHLDMVRGSTGFVTSRLVRLRGAGEPTSEKLVIDLNLENGVQSAMPVTQPTDVLVYGSGKDDETRVFVTGMSSDTVAMVTPTSLEMLVTRIDVSDQQNKFERHNLAGVMRGPRSFAIKASGTAGDTSDRVYVYNRVEHSITVLDPNFPVGDPTQAVRMTFPLQRDPTPAIVHEGRKYLYSSELSGAGNVSCASCHIDGNTDFLAWNLSNGVPVPPKGQGLAGALGPNAAVKGPLVTQSLRGLVNFEVENAAQQKRYFSNAPYHWRGDKGQLLDFNAAFVNLMDIDDPFFVNPDDGARNKGIPDADMAAFVGLVNSIHYPPNPEQPLTRVYSGSMGNPNDETAGDGAQRGLKLFHIGPLSMGKRSCIVCHALPVGTTPAFGGDFLHLGSGLELQSLETSALRGLVLKEKLLYRTGADGTVRKVPEGTAGAVNGEFGLIHTGKNTLVLPGTSQLSGFHSDSILDFMPGFVGDPDGAGVREQLNVITRYLREFDTGVAPIIGRTETIDQARLVADPAGASAAIDLLEAQARLANAGLAVYARLDGVERGFWYDVTASDEPYVEQEHGGILVLGPPLSRAGLLAHVDPGTGSPDNLLIFQATALGSDRRVADLDGGVPQSSTADAPTSVLLLPCPTNTANQDAPRMTLNWVIPNLVTFFSRITSNQTLTWYEYSLVTYTKTAQPKGFGLTELRADAPRRLRVKGDGIVPGAWLKIHAPANEDISKFTKDAPPTRPFLDAEHPFAFELPIFPARDSGGQLVWETAVEFENRFLFGMMNGGPNNALVEKALDKPGDPQVLKVVEFDVFKPQQWNWWWVTVQNDRNDPDSKSAGSWQRLIIE